MAFLGGTDDALTVWRRGRFLDEQGLGNLCAAEPPVVLIRVVPPGIEAHIGRGFALSHTPMLTLTCNDTSKCWHTRGIRQR